jgi:hypothetical protein
MMTKENPLMDDLLVWLYLANSVLLINHEIDSAYWKEWQLFKLQGDVTGFLLIHFPLLFLILWGLILVSRHSSLGLVLSVVLSVGGIFAFTVHTYFLRKGRPEFNKPISKFILVATLLVSMAQLVATVYMMMT